MLVKQKTANIAIEFRKTCPPLSGPRTVAGRFLSVDHLGRANVHSNVDFDHSTDGWEVRCQMHASWCRLNGEDLSLEAEAKIAGELISAVWKSGSIEDYAQEHTCT
ncbi:MAG: hypothetical protein ACI97A_002853 [Planctomycetota bacterium]|jgi:hypothetical protein